MQEHETLTDHGDIAAIVAMADSSARSRQIFTNGHGVTDVPVPSMDDDGRITWDPATDEQPANVPPSLDLDKQRVATVIPALRHRRASR